MRCSENFSHLMFKLRDKIGCVKNPNGGLLFYLNDVAKTLDIKNLLKAIENIGLAIDSAKIDEININRLPFKALRNGKYEIVIEESDVFRLMLNSSNQLARSFDREVFDCIIPKIVGEMSEKQKKALFGDLYVLVKKEKKTI